MILTLITSLLAVHNVVGSYCHFSSTCYTNRYETTRYSTGWFNYVYKLKLVTTSYQCTNTACCTGYTGSYCSQALCFGSTSCPNGGSCTSPNYCTCPSGFSSPYCRDIDECSTNNGGCSDYCTNTVGSYQCSCDSGYVLDSDGKTCKAVCFGSTTCLNGGTCISPDQCSCRPGFAKPHCEDVDECMDHNGGCTQHCSNTVGSYYCYCENGLSIDQTTGKNCTDDDECSTKNGGCNHKCINAYESFRCECYSGFKLASDRKTCKDIDECQTNSRCTQTCHNTNGSYTCGCNIGFYLSSDGFTCIDADDCINIECKNGATCLDGVGTFNCKCVQGYEGTYCEKDIDECTFSNGGCEETCVNTNGSYFCQCTTELNSDGTCKASNDTLSHSVFEVHKIPRQLLPKGCAILELMACDENSPDQKIAFSSTTNWYQMSTNTSVFYTHGIVFVELDSLSLPVSVTGLRVVSTESGFDLSFGSLSFVSQNDIRLENKRNEDCFFFSTTPRDVLELMRSFVPTFFRYIENVMPSWIRFITSDVNVVSITDLRTDMLNGRQLATDSDCKGAPLYDSHFYNVFRIGNDFNISLFGNEVSLLKSIAGNKVCILVDICQDNAETVFILLPPESRDVLDKFDFMTSIYLSSGVRFRPRGIGLSIPGSINVKNTVSSLQFWNGAEHFTYSTLKSANVWMDTNVKWFKKFGDLELSVDVRADLFIGIPSLSTLLSGMYVEEWNVLFRITELFVTPVLRFELFGDEVILEFKNLVAASFDGYISIGGSFNRVWCGNGANPEGVYASFYVNLNPFQNIALFKEWIFDVNVRMFAFLAVDTDGVALSNRPIDMFNEILDLKQIVNTFKAMIFTFKDSLKDRISKTARQLLVELHNTSSTFIAITDEFLGNDNPNLGDVSAVISKLWQFFHDFINKIVNTLLDTLEFHIDDMINNMKDYLEKNINDIRQKISGLISKTQKEVFKVLDYTTGFGFKFSADINLMKLGFGPADVELVYSLDRLAECSKFKNVYSILKGEKSLKIMARLVKSHKFGYFIKTELVNVPIEGTKSAALSIAFALSKFKFVAHLNAYITVLGLKVSSDILISNKMIMFQIEGNIWNVFFARISFEASMENSWYDLIYNVQGNFLVKQGENDFGGSYLDGLRNFAKKVVDAAIIRLDMAKAGLLFAQRGLTWAQGKLTVAQEKVRTANSAFDEAVRSLENAKYRVEQAKRPFKDAIRKLEEAQRRVDGLCRIRSCSPICIPGFIWRRCGGWITYPCPSWTNCMYKIPNIPCEVANAACRVLRGIAYAALEAAKWAVRTFMVALDIAKAALSVAQYAVNASRVVLLIADRVLEIAKVGLETAKTLMEAAKAAIDSIKFLLKASLYVFDLIIKYGLQSLIDVRNCRFEYQLSTTDKSFFDVSCEVKAFSLDWHTFKFEFDFKNPIVSMWKVAKSTVETLFDFVKKLFGKRRRREVSYDAMNKLHHILRICKRDVAIEFNQTDFSDSLNGTFSKDFGTYFESKFKNKIEYFAHHCDIFQHIHSFLTLSIDNFISITKESAETIGNITTTKKDFINTNISSFNTTDGNQTVDSFGINTEYALKEFNISQEQIDNVLEGVLSNFTEDPYISQMINVSNAAANNMDEELEAANSMSLMPQWVEGMANTTKTYFDETKCYGFKDCVLYAFSELYDVFSDNSISGVNDSRVIITNLEDQFMNLLSNDSWTIRESFDISVQMQPELEKLNKTNTWCSSAPVIKSDLFNQTILLGKSVTLTCSVSGDPKPVIRWYFNESIIENENGDVLMLKAVTYEQIGMYRCEAENLLTTVKSADMYLTMTECAPGSYYNGRKCVPCAKGYYQPLTDQLQCNKCDGDSTTANIGVQQKKECYAEDDDVFVKVVACAIGGVACLALIVFVSIYFLKANKPSKVNPFNSPEHQKKSIFIQEFGYPECKGDVVKQQSN